MAIGRAGDRDIIVSGSADETVRVWDAVTGDPAGAPLEGHDDSVNAVAIGRAGDRDIIVSGSDDRHGAGLGRGHRRPGRRPAGGHDDCGERGGDRAGRGPRHHRLRLRRRHGAGLGRGHRRPGRRRRWHGHDRAVYAVAIGRAGDRDVIVSGSADGTVRVWDAVTGDPVGAPLAGHDNSVNAVAIGRAGDRDVIVSGSDDGTVRVWDAVTGSRSARR